jgi:hypothetical protein
MLAESIPGLLKSLKYRLCCSLRCPKSELALLQKPQNINILNKASVPPPPHTYFCALRSGFPSANHRLYHEVNIEEEESGYLVFKNTQA